MEQHIERIGEECIKLPWILYFNWDTRLIMDKLVIKLKPQQQKQPKCEQNIKLYG